MVIAEAVSRDVATVPALAPGAAFLLAHVHLSIARTLRGADARSSLEGAAAHARRFAALLEKTPVEEWEELARLTLVDAHLRLGHSADAEDALRVAHERVVHRARHMRLVPHREAYLERVPEVQATLALAETRLGLRLPTFGPPALPKRG